MFLWKCRFGYSSLILMDENTGKEGGGGGGKTPPAEPTVADLKAKNDALEARLAALEGKATPPPPKDLKDKAADHAKDRDKASSDSKALESAIKFNLSSSDFLKTNAALLPKSVSDIFTVAEKEKYDSAVEKASDIKAGIIHAFFSVQDNVNLLTPSQKAALEDYLKLTKNGRQENAQQFYDSVFEPTLEMLKRVKKTEEVNRAKNGFGDGTDEAYKKKLISGSKHHYLGEKKDA